MITENLNQVRKNIQEACEVSGRDPKEVTLIAVSKTKPVLCFWRLIMQGQECLVRIRSRRSWINIRSFQRISSGI